MPRHFANWLTAYMEFTSDSESPDDFHFWSGVSTLAGALRRRVWIDMRKFEWTPNFYIILVGQPGIVTKSTSIRTGMRLLEQVPNVHFGPPSMTWQALAESLSAAIEHMKMLSVDGGETFIPMSCLTIPVSELGTFMKIDDTALVDVLVDLWDGQLSAWGHKTKTQGAVEIKNPWLNIIGCTTPSWLKSHFPEHMIGGGLTSRIIFIFGDTKRKLVPYPDELRPDAEYRQLETYLVDDLKQIAELSGPYTLTQDARHWGHDWYKKHWNGARPAHLASDRYGGYLARKQTHIHKLALVLAAARSDDKRITADVLIEAEAVLATTEPHMLKVFESIGIVDEARHVKELVGFVRAHGFLTSESLYKLTMNTMNQKEFTEALTGAVRGGLLIIEHRNNQRGVVAGAVH